MTGLQAAAASDSGLSSYIAIFGIAVGFLAAMITAIVAPQIVASSLRKVAAADRAADAAARLEEKRADWKRQDEVAEKAAKAATDLVASQKKIADAAEKARLQAAEAATLLAANNVLVAQTSGAISGQLSQIHTLVNSNMTAAMQSEYDAVGRELAMMLEVIELRRSAGQEPATQALAAVEATRAKRSELAAKLEDRAAAQKRNDNATAAAAAAAAAAAREAG